MNKKQTLRAAEIMSKFDEPNWFIEARDWPSCGGKNEWSRFDNPCGSLFWNWICKEYRAVNIEKEQIIIRLPITFYRKGMMVDLGASKGYYIVYKNPESSPISLQCINESGDLYNPVSTEIVAWKWAYENYWAKSETVQTKDKIVKIIDLQDLYE